MSCAIASRIKGSSGKRATGRTPGRAACDLGRRRIADTRPCSSLSDQVEEVAAGLSMFTWISSPITGYLPEFALLGLLDRERTKVHLAIFFRRGRGYAPRRFTVGFRNRSPTCPSCLDPGLPIHITWHFEIFSGSSSGMISTTCPRLSRNVPMSLNPSGELSTMRQGSLFGIRSRLTTRLAPFFRTIRFDRRFS